MVSAQYGPWARRAARTAAGCLAGVAALLIGGASPAAAAEPSAPARLSMPISSRLEGGSCAVGGPRASRQLAFAPDQNGGMPAIGLAAFGSPTNGGLHVTCALPSRRNDVELAALNPLDCAEWYTVSYQVFGASRNAKVKAEAIGYDINGIVIDSLPVKQGDPVMLKSVNPPPNASGRLEIRTINRKKGPQHKVVAPVPMLKVTVEDNGQTATAYCSNVSWYEVIQPQSTVVTDTNGSNVTNVLVAAPRVDAQTLSLKVDGVDIFNAPTAPLLTACTPNTPCATFTVDINGTSATISNLVVDIADYYEEFSSNTIRFSLEDQSCGGHVYVFDGERNPPPPNSKYANVQNRCYRDDVLDTGLSSVFAVNVATPFDGARLPAPPVRVTGEACGGREITKLTLNGKPQSLRSQVCTLGNGVTTGDTCRVPFDDQLAETNIEADLSNGTLPIGTLDLGANRIAAAASDDLGNRAFDNVTVVAGATAAPGIELQTLLQQSAIDMALQNEIKAAVMPDVQDAMQATSMDVQNAFVVGLTAQATKDLFAKLCSAPLPAFKKDGTPNDASLVGKTPAQIFKLRAEAALEGKFVTANVDPVCAPTVSVKTTVDNVGFGTIYFPNGPFGLPEILPGTDDVRCEVDFQQDKFHVTLRLPDIRMRLESYGTSGEWGNDICFGAGAKIEGTTFGSITGIRLDFDVTEGQLMGQAAPAPNFFAGTKVEVGSSVDADYCGIGGALCSFFVTVFTFGQIDLLSGQFDFQFNQDFSRELAGAEHDPIELNKIKVDEQTVANFDQKLSGAVTKVEIDPTGIRAGLKGTFTTTAVDSEIDPTLGGVLTPNNNLPTFDQVKAKDVFIGLSDDTVNMLFASMTAAGKLKGECTDTGRTLGSLLDLNKDNFTNTADCDTLTVDTGKPVQDALATAGARGLCYGFLNADCDTINLNPGNPNDLNTATAQGVCHATRGDDCNHLSLAAGPLAAVTEKQVCTVTPNPNIHADQKLLFCARQELPPRMLFSDNPATSNAVESTLRMNDLSVVLVLDRNNSFNTGTPDGAINTALGDVPGCFTQGTATNVDCNLFATCLDLSVDFSVQKATTQCPADKPGFVNKFTKLEYTQERGYICGAGGTTAGTDSAVISSSQTDQTVTIDLTAAAQNAAPPICGAGLNLGLFGACGDANIFAADVAPAGTLKDFIGLTCKLQ